VERALRESEARVRGAVEASLDALLIARAVRDPDGTVVDFVCIDANARASAIVHIGGEALVGKGVTELFPVLLPVFKGVLESGRPYEAELETAGHASAPPWIRLQVVPVSDGIGITARDITEQKRAEATLRALALVDELTGVHNRRGFMALAEREWQRATREGRGAVLAYIDLNDFKGINDLHGHAEGDRALQTIAEVLRAAFRGADVIGRLGGDEFAVLVVPTGSTHADIDEIYEVERRILRRLTYHLDLSNSAMRAAGRGYDIRMSIGTAVVASVGGQGADGGHSLASLMVTADERLYQQKRTRGIAA
jgi:diguanylate cyclase (GGDEF)-like protein